MPESTHEVTLRILGKVIPQDKEGWFECANCGDQHNTHSSGGTIPMTNLIKKHTVSLSYLKKW